MTLPVVDAAMDDLRAAHRGLLNAVDSLADGDWSRYVPYGDWTVKDLVAHCIGDMSPSGVGLILAGILTPQFIADTARTFDVRARNAGLVAERRDYTREDLRQMLFACHDAMHGAALKLTDEHLPVLAYTVPMGPGYDLHVEDWLWHGYHDRQHADDIRRAVELDWQPDRLAFLPEIEGKLRALTRSREGLLRAVHSVADEVWEEESAAAPGWTYKDILAHTAANDMRAQGRIRFVLGESGEAELAALNETHTLNQRLVEERRAVPVRALVDELVANRHETLRLLSRLRPEHLTATVTLADGTTPAVAEYIELIGEHESEHAGQLVPATRARRWRKHS